MLFVRPLGRGPLWVIRVVLAPCHQLPVYPQDRTWHQFSALFSTLPKRLKRTTATPETALRPLAQCQIVGSRTFSRSGVLWAPGIIGLWRSSIAHHRRS
jgi:hypothetical protein